MKTYRIFRIGMHCALVACVLATMLAVAWGQTSGEQVAAGLRQPLNLSAAVEDANGNVNLSWVENNTCMSGYSIERTVAGSAAFLAVGKSGPYSAGFTDQNVEAGKYVYRVRALLDSTQGPPSGHVSVTVPPRPAESASSSPAAAVKPFAAPTPALISAFTPSSDGRPYFRRQGVATQLVCDGKPFLMLSGQIENNTISYPKELGVIDDVLNICKGQNLNTVEVPIQWRALEPTERQFDFRVVDAFVDGCRKRDLKMIILWFGTWKNSESYYAPSWVINNTRRYFRAKKHNGGDHGMVSAWCEEACQADIRAFTRLMGHLKETDGKQRTVVIVQVENETGMFAGESRDRSAAATQAWNTPMPARLMAYLVAHKDELGTLLRDLWRKQGFRAAGTWTEVFGPSIWTDEVFMAWQIAQYIERATEAGKTLYPLPMYVNAWLDGGKPGDYPTGGPVAKMHDVWRAAAPSLDAFAPDIYLAEYRQICQQYNTHHNPMLIPESIYGEPSAAAAFYAFEEVDAMLFGPYWIEGYLTGYKHGGYDKSGNLHPIMHTYALLREMAPVVLKHQGDGSMAGFFQQRDNKGAYEKHIGDMHLRATCNRLAYGGKWAGEPLTPPRSVPGGALAIGLEGSEFVVAGTGLTVSFGRDDSTQISVASAQVGSYHAGEWTPGKKRKLTEPEVRLSNDHIEAIRIVLKTK